MKRTLLIMSLLMSVQAFAFEASSKKNDDLAPKVEEEKKKDKGISSSSGSLYTDVECDMTDYTCYKIIMDLGRQEAIAHIVAGNPAERSTVLTQAIQVYKTVNAEAQNLTDEEIIYLLATE
ncbi:hypothetical protein QJS83_05760 [Bdellovibrio sp. 22V]|uniref:hypothetical protein n=1 Tax=Bdellovibrio TaxID=958 RepID=UPI002543D554|nr:hypothetical protein [Bdellovibrio sp. 22V]WII73375.1 hypothetical protein QJS83_05760 [Bdellovibrio sp. 22V]